MNYEELLEKRRAILLDSLSPDQEGPITPFNRLKGTYYPLDPFAFLELIQFEVIGVEDDTILCYKSGDKDKGLVTYVAKPAALRVSALADASPDTVLIDGLDHLYSSATEKTVQDPDGVLGDETWIITPSYRTVSSTEDGEIINAMHWNTGLFDGDTESNIYYEEVTMGRCWAVEVT